MDWGGGASGAISGASAGAALGPYGAAVGGLAGFALGAFGGSATPQYDPNADPNVIKSRILADNLMSSKTGEDFYTHSAAMNEHRGKAMFDEISRDYSGNPAVSGALYDKIERNTENENTTAGVEGASMNDANKRTAAGILENNAGLSYSAWKDGQDRASRPSAFDTIATQAVGKLAGAGVDALGGGAGGAAGGGGSSGGGTVNSTALYDQVGRAVPMGASPSVRLPSPGLRTWGDPNEATTLDPRTQFFM